MKAFAFFTTLFASAFVSLATAQDFETSLPQLGAKLDGKTIVKTDLLGALATNSYGIGLERILGENLSLQLSSYLKPKSAAPTIFSSSFDNDDKYKQFHIELALRLYLSKTGYGHGFYFQGLYSYTSITRFGTQNFYLSQDRRVTYDKKIYGSIHGFGLGLGVQWLVGKKRNIVVDWTILQLSRDPKARQREEYYLPQNADITPTERKYLVETKGQGDMKPYMGSEEYHINFSEDASYGVRSRKGTVWMPAMRLAIGFRF